jgi:hypothetical protein
MILLYTWRYVLSRTVFALFSFSYVTLRMRKKGYVVKQTEMSRKNPAAVALGRKGGEARAKKLTAAGRSESARRAVEARWAKTRELVDEITERSKELEKRALARLRKMKKERTRP